MDMKNKIMIKEIISEIKYYYGKKSLIMNAYSWKSVKQNLYIEK